jgi:hypothetical protein
MLGSVRINKIVFDIQEREDLEPFPNDTDDEGDEDDEEGDDEEGDDDEGDDDEGDDEEGDDDREKRENITAYT